MLPSFLCSTYKQYKEDTKYVTEWLAQNAKFRGYVFSSPTTSAPKLVPIKKIKNKKKALEAEQARQSQAKPYMVSTKELLALAQYVARCDRPPVVIPSSIISTVKRTIKARQFTGNYYNAAMSGSDEDDGHAFFIQTFQSILELLGSVVHPNPAPTKLMTRPYPPRSRSSNSTAKPQDPGSRTVTENTNAGHDMASQVAEDKSLHHSLLALDLEESDPEASGTVTPDSRKPPDDAKPPQFSAEPMPQKTKLQFATTCLFRDIHRIARHLTSLWELYAEGKADLVAVTVTSACGINVITRLEDDFRAEFPEIKDMQELLQMFYAGWVFGPDLDDLLNADPTHSGNIEELQRAEYCFFPMFRRMAFFIQFYEPTVAPIYVSLQESEIDTAKPRRAKTVQERIREDDSLFQTLTPSLHWEMKRIQRDTGTGGMVLDPLLRALKSFWLRGNELLLWHIVAGQCCLEAFHATKGVPDKALGEVRAYCRGLKRSASKIDDTFGKKFITLWDAFNKDVDELLVDDPMSRFIAQHTSLGDPEPPPPFDFLTKSPMLCGMHAFSMMEDLQGGSIYLVRTPAIIFSIAHLVNAVHQEGMCSAGWPELERMIQIQGEEFIFYGGRPETPEQYSSRYKLLKGLSAVNHAANRRSNRQIKSKREPRTLKENLPTSSLLRKWWGVSTDDTNLVHVEQLLNECFEGVPEEEAAKLGSRGISAPEDVAVQYVAVRKRQASMNGRKLRNKYQQTKKLTPIEFLGALECSMTHETPMLKFDYLELHRQCKGLLHLIAIRMDDLLSAGYGPEWLSKNKDDEHVVVTLILDAGAEGSKMAKHFFRARELERGGGQSRFLFEAGRIVEEFLEELAKERKEGSNGEYDEAAYATEA